MLLNDVTLHDENFFPTITQTSDGQVYLMRRRRGRASCGSTGWTDIRRLPTGEVAASRAEDLTSAAAWRMQAEAQRQAARGSGRCTVAIRNGRPGRRRESSTTGPTPTGR